MLISDSFLPVSTSASITAGEKIKTDSFSGELLFLYQILSIIYIFSYLVALVKEGVLKEITVSYLMVGHTGNSVDQLFRFVSYRIWFWLFKTSSINDSVDCRPALQLFFLF